MKQSKWCNWRHEASTGSVKYLHLLEVVWNTVNGVTEGMRHLLGSGTSCRCQVTAIHWASHTYKPYPHPQTITKVVFVSIIKHIHICVVFLSYIYDFMDLDCASSAKWRRYIEHLTPTNPPPSSICFNYLMYLFSTHFHICLTDQHSAPNDLAPKRENNRLCK